eukprot:3128289-Pleurochrysis_carterae.AAC.4
MGATELQEAHSAPPPRGHAPAFSMRGLCPHGLIGRFFQPHAFGRLTSFCSCCCLLSLSLSFATPSLSARCSVPTTVLLRLRACVAQKEYIHTSIIIIIYWFLEPGIKRIHIYIAVDAIRIWHKGPFIYYKALNAFIDCYVLLLVSHAVLGVLIATLLGLSVGAECVANGAAVIPPRRPARGAGRCQRHRSSPFCPSL